MWVTLETVAAADLQFEGPAFDQGYTTKIRRFFGGGEMASWLRETGKGGGLRPPLFHGGKNPLRPQNSSTIGFYISAPFGATPFYGCPRRGGVEPRVVDVRRLSGQLVLK